MIPTIIQANRWVAMLAAAIAGMFGGFIVLELFGQPTPLSSS